MSPTAKLGPGEFLKQFFGSPNQLTQTSKLEIRSWVEQICGPTPQPTVLPCWRNDCVEWYGLAFDERQLRALGESLTAFVGPTYTTFRGQLAHLNLSDPIDAVVSEFTSGLAYKFNGANPKAIWAMLERMRRVWERRGTIEQATPEPLGYALQKFFMALEAQDAIAAENQLNRLREEYHLDNVNLLYLRVQNLEAFRRWNDLLNISGLPDLLRLRRPVAVTEAILKAVYNDRLSCFEALSDTTGAISTFRNEVLPQYTQLFAARSGMRSPEALKAFMLLAITEDPSDVTLRDTLLLEKGLTDRDRSYLEELSNRANWSNCKSELGNTLTAAEKFAEECDFDRAFVIAITLTPSPSQARLVCECAYELGTIETRSAAARVVNALPFSEREEFLGRRINRQLWEMLQKQTDQSEIKDVEPVPTDWSSWLEHLDRTEGKMGTREIARIGATEWSVEKFLNRHDAVERFAGQLVGKRSQSAENALRDSLPHLVHAFTANPDWPNHEYKSIYRSLLELLYFSTDGGRADLIVFNDLLEAVLTLGVKPTDYVDLLSYVNDLWDRFASPATFQWAMDALALLIAFPCPDNKTRLSYFQLILDRCAEFARLIGPVERELIRLQAADLGQSALAESYFPPTKPESLVADDLFAPLQGLSVAAYTLTERAAKQFQSVLQALIPNVRVSLAHDTEASSRLKQLAKQADIFVLVTSSAKHAATDCVRANRPSEKPTLMPTGKGAASMLAVVREFCQRESS